MLQRLAVALAIGLLLGLERERSHRAAGRQAAGSRTFALLSLTGALAGAIDPVVVAAGALAVGMLMAAGYARTSAEDPGATTEAAGVAAYLLGALSWQRPQPAVSTAVVIAVLLASKARLHHFAREVITEHEVDDALKFFVVAFVVLPLLPDRNVGPYAALNPTRIWILVIAVTGIGWVGYVATRTLGANRGLPLAGFAGGFVSGSATTAAMGRRVHADPGTRSGALAGALLASLATLVQLAMITAVANVALFRRLLPALATGAAVLVGEAIMIGRVDARTHPRSEPQTAVADSSNRAFSFWPALLLAGVLTTVLLVARWGEATFGAAGSIGTTALAGLADVHAAVLSVATLASAGNVDLSTAVVASGLALATNTGVKCALATVSGGRRFGISFGCLILPPTVSLGILLGLAL